MSRIRRLLVLGLILGFGAAAAEANPWHSFWTETEDSIEVVDHGDGVTAVIPCTLRYHDPSLDPRKTTSPIDLLWSFETPTMSSKDYVYLYNVVSDQRTAVGKYGNMFGDGTKYEERYYLRIRNMSEKYEGKYCCDLNYNTNPSRVNCTNVFFKYINQDNYNVVCDARNPGQTRNIVIKADRPAIVSARLSGFYPARNDPLGLEGDPGPGRRFRIWDRDSLQYVQTTSFTQNPTNNTRYDVQLTWNWNKPGLYLFTAILPSAKFNSDEKSQRCHYIEGPNRCAHEPCQHGGDCISQKYGFTCRCQNGYTGSLCQTDIDDCEGKDCNGQGTCVDGRLDYTCQCHPHYWGKDCEKLNYCFGRSCSGHGTCTNLDSGYRCDCEGSYSGRRCEFGDGCIHPESWQGKWLMISYFISDEIRMAWYHTYTATSEQQGIWIKGRDKLLSGGTYTCEMSGSPSPHTFIYYLTPAPRGGGLQCAKVYVEGRYHKRYNLLAYARVPRASQMTITECMKSDEFDPVSIFVKHPLTGRRYCGFSNRYRYHTTVKSSPREGYRCGDDPNSIVLFAGSMVFIETCVNGSFPYKPTHAQLQCVGEVPASVIGSPESNGKVLILKNYGATPERAFFYIMRYIEHSDGVIEMSVQGSHDTIQRLRPDPTMSYNTAIQGITFAYAFYMKPMPRRSSDPGTGTGTGNETDPSSALHLNASSDAASPDTENKNNFLSNLSVMAAAVVGCVAVVAILIAVGAYKVSRTRDKAKEPLCPPSSTRQAKPDSNAT